MLFLHHIMSMILAKHNMLQDIVISEHINMNDRQRVMYSTSAFMLESFTMFKVFFPCYCYLLSKDFDSLVFGDIMSGRCSCSYEREVFMFLFKHVLMCLFACHVVVWTTDGIKVYSFSHGMYVIKIVDNQIFDWKMVKKKTDRRQCFHCTFCLSFALEAKVNCLGMGVYAIPTEAVEGSAFCILQSEDLKVFGLRLQDLGNLRDCLILGFTKDLSCKADKGSDATSGEFEALELSALFVFVVANLPAFGDVLFCMVLYKCHEGIVVDDGVLWLCVSCILHSFYLPLITGVALLVKHKSTLTQWNKNAFLLLDFPSWAFAQGVITQSVQ